MFAPRPPHILVHKKFDPIIEKLMAMHDLQSTEAAHRQSVEKLIEAGGTEDAKLLALEYEYQDTGLLSLPDELMLLVFKFFDDIPLCLARLAMTCRQLYMLTSKQRVLFWLVFFFFRSTVDTHSNYY